jgi:hypothetical protein
VTSPFRQPRDLGALVVAFVIILAGFTLASYDRGYLGWPLVILGIVGQFMAFQRHDLVHLKRGETPHAMWGVGDRSRPKRLGGPRLGRETNTNGSPTTRQWAIRVPIIALVYGVLHFARTHSVVGSAISGVGFGILFPLLVIAFEKGRGRRS